MTVRTRLAFLIGAALVGMLVVALVLPGLYEAGLARRAAEAQVTHELLAAARNGAGLLDAEAHVKVSLALDPAAPEWKALEGALGKLAERNHLPADRCLTFGRPSADVTRLRHAVAVGMPKTVGTPWDLAPAEQELLRQIVASKEAVATVTATAGGDAVARAMAPILTVRGEIAGILRLEAPIAPALKELGGARTGWRGRLTPLLAAAVLFFAVMGLGRRWVAVPFDRLQEMTTALAEGRPGRDAAGGLDGDFAQLAQTIQSLDQRHRELVVSARAASESVARLTAKLSQEARQLSDDTSHQSRATEHTSSFVVRVDTAAQSVSNASSRVTNLVIETTASIEEMMAQVREIDRSAASLSNSTNVTASAIQEMGANIAEVAQNADKLSEQVADASVAAEQMGRSVQNVDRSSRDLLRAADATSAAMARAMDSIRHVERSAQQSEKLAQVVVADAENGSARVRFTIDGMEALRLSIVEVGEVIAHLEQSSLAIGQILDLIEKVAQQTNVLALNAALIAAHAGEEGKAFGVVAAKIRELSASTSERTKDIARLVASVRGDVSQATTAAQRAQVAMERGSQFAEEAVVGLEKILGSAREASQLSQGIARATVEQLQVGTQISEAMERVKNLIGDISRATDEQAKGSMRLVETMDSLRDRANLFKRATVELRTGSVQIVTAIDNVAAQVKEISRATDEQARGGKAISRAVAEMETSALALTNSATDQSRDSKKAVDSVVEIGEIVGRNVGRAQQIDQAVSVLLTESQKLLGDVASLAR